MIFSPFPVLFSALLYRCRFMNILLLITNHHSSESEDDVGLKGIGLDI